MTRRDIRMRAARREWNARSSDTALTDGIMAWGIIGLVLTVLGMIVSAL